MITKPKKTVIAKNFDSFKGGVGDQNIFIVFGEILLTIWQLAIR